MKANKYIKKICHTLTIDRETRLHHKINFGYGYV